MLRRIYTALDLLCIQVLKQLVERRRQVKNMLKNEQNPIKRQQHDIRQQALKLTANRWAFGPSFGLIQRLAGLGPCQL